MINTSSGLDGVFRQGVSGLHQANRNMVESANDLVRQGTVVRTPSATDIVEPLIEISQQQHVFNASAKVVDIADQALGNLIDIGA